MTLGAGGQSGVSAPAAEALALLDEMLRLYVRAEEMNAEAARSEDGTGALEALRRRQAVVDALRERDAELGAVRERLARGTPTPADRAAVERKLALVAGAARRLADADESLRVLLAKRRDSLADELAAAGRGRSAHSAYARPLEQGGARMKDMEV